MGIESVDSPEVDEELGVLQAELRPPDGGVMKIGDTAPDEESSIVECTVLWYDGPSRDGGVAKSTWPVDHFRSISPRLR